MDKNYTMMGMNLNFQSLLYVPLSYLFFEIFNRVLGQTTVPKRCKKPRTWANILTSFTHSFITGSGSIYVFSSQPESLTAMISTKDSSGIAVYLCLITVGYFIYDLIDMIKDTDSGIDVSLLVHHSVAICCFGLAIIEQDEKFRIYAMGALLHEVQSVFLHFRRLLNLAKVDRDTKIYFYAKYANLISFLIFRFFVNYLMIVETWLKANDYFFMNSVYMALAINILFMLLNFDVFFKILKSDFSVSSFKQKDKKRS